MSDLSTASACPVCGLENTYPDGDNFVCPDCAHEWPKAVNAGDGDAVILIKDLKVRGSSIVLKKGTKVKSIRLPEGAGDHEVDCRTDQGGFMLKAYFLKKA